MSICLRCILIIPCLWAVVSAADVPHEVQLDCSGTADACVKDLAHACAWTVASGAHNKEACVVQGKYAHCEEAYEAVRRMIPSLQKDGANRLRYLSHDGNAQLWYSPEFLSVQSMKKQLKLWLHQSVMKKFGFFESSAALFFPSEHLETVKKLDVHPLQIHLHAIMWTTDVHYKKNIGIAPQAFSHFTLDDFREHLHVMESNGTVQVLAEPQLYLGVAHKALVSSGEEIPYQITGTRNARISFKKAYLTLAVKAQHIGQHGVSLDVDIAFDKPSEHVYHGHVGIARQVLKTSVRIPFYKGMMMGGVRLQRQSVQKNCLPFVGSLPYVGGIFCDNIHIDKKSFLYVMLYAQPAD